MAELLLKVGTVGPDPLYQDGDIVCAFNRRHIRCVHAQIISHVNNFGFTSQNLRPASLAQSFLENTKQYKFERISRTQVQRTNLITLQQETFSDVPNQDGKYIDVVLYLQRRSNHQKHMIFGTSGSEVWYGGITDVSDTKLDLVWSDIESQTPNREIDFTLWPLTDTEKRNFLSVSVDDFTNAEALQMVTPEYEDDGTVDEGGGLSGPIQNKRVAQKRLNFVDWQSRTWPVPPGLINNKNQIVDFRENLQLRRNDILQTKPGKGN